MASYSMSSDALGSQLAAAGLSAATVAAISAILGSTFQAENYTPGQEVAAGTGALNVQSDITQADSSVTNSQAIIQDAAYSMQMDFGSNAATQLVVVGGAGNSNVTFGSNKDITVQLQGGENDSVTTAGGADTVIINGGSAQVGTGAGNDNVIFQSEPAAASINAGDGFDTVSMTEGSFNIQNVGGRLHVMSNGRAADATDAEITNVNVVGFGGDGDNTFYNRISVIAQDDTQGMIAKLYQIALGRTDGAIDRANVTAAQQLDGLQWWFDKAENIAASDSAGLQDLYYSFLNCDEFKNVHQGQNELAYVTSLFQSLGLSSTSTIDGHGIDYYTAQLDGTMQSMFDVAIEIAQATQVSSLLGIDGTDYVIGG